MWYGAAAYDEGQKNANSIFQSHCYANSNWSECVQDYEFGARSRSLTNKFLRDILFGSFLFCETWKLEIDYYYFWFCTFITGQQLRRHTVDHTSHCWMLIAIYAIEIDGYAYKIDRQFVGADAQNKQTWIQFQWTQKQRGNEMEKKPNLIWMFEDSNCFYFCSHMDRSLCHRKICKEIER